MKIFENSEIIDNEDLRQNKIIDKNINFDNLVQTQPSLNEENQ